jgi:Protein of unknown function (DUF3048) N-terminal domain/Protein of unknown function (DUF3048) C-terminal domain
LNTGESRASRWFVCGASGAVLCGVLAAVCMLSPMPGVLAQDAFGRLATAAHATPHRAGMAAGSRLGSTLPSAFLTGPLDGEPTPRADALRRPIAVTIDNYFPDSRPQSGIGDASVVFETLVEGGFTRLMAIYLERDPAVVGPVRSTRIYFDDWAAAYHAILAHVGGNDDADAQLWQMRPVYNLDQGTEAFVLGDANPYFWRSADRSMPDNMYANVAKLRAYAASRGQNWRYSQASLPHKVPKPLAARGGPGTLTLSFVDPLFPGVQALPDYQVQYRFDRATDSYLRVVGGAPQMDAATHTSISAQNIVVMQTGAGSPDLAAGTTVDAVSIPVIGSGSAVYFRDGRVEHGTWQQSDALAPLQLLNRQGRPVRFNPGQTWIEALPLNSNATWTFH